MVLDGDRALVTDLRRGVVLSVDLLDGDRAILASPGLEAAVPLAASTIIGGGGDIDVYPARRWAVFADPRVGHIAAMDFVTGETIAFAY